MKSLQLTHKQRDKLMEMCKALFPKHEIKMYDINGMSISISEFEMKGKIKSFDIPHGMSWFELCMTHLQDKLKQKGGFKHNFDCDIELMSCWYESHPVDYLYKVFKLTNLTYIPNKPKKK